MQGLGQRHPSVRDQLVQRLAGHILHDDEVGALGLVDFVDGDNVGMTQA
jgi:hypothetical protein